jgi:hypothetical protein
VQNLLSDNVQIFKLKIVVKELLSLIARAFDYAIFDLARFAADESVPIARRKMLDIIGFVVTVDNRMQDLVELA